LNAIEIEGEREREKKEDEWCGSAVCSAAYTTQTSIKHATSI